MGGGAYEGMGPFNPGWKTLRACNVRGARRPCMWCGLAAPAAAGRSVCHPLRRWGASRWGRRRVGSAPSNRGSTLRLKHSPPPLPVIQASLRLCAGIALGPCGGMLLDARLGQLALNPAIRLERKGMRALCTGSGASAHQRRRFCGGWVFHPSEGKMPGWPGAIWTR